MHSATDIASSDPNALVPSVLALVYAYCPDRLTQLVDALKADPRTSNLNYTDYLAKLGG